MKDGDNMSGQEPGTRVHVPERHLDESPRVLDLRREPEELKRGRAWDELGHRARTLVKHDDLRVVMIVLREGATVAEHRAPVRISIQILTGRVSLKLPERELSLAAGMLLALDRSVPHSLTALEESTILLTLCWETGANESELHS